MSLASTLIRERFRRRDGKYAGAGPHMGAPPGGLQAFSSMIEQLQATARGAVMAGAERQRRLDLDAELVGRNAQTVMPAVHDEAPGAHRRQFFQRRLDPVPGLPAMSKAICCAASPPAARPTSSRIEVLVGWFGKMHGNAPTPVGPLKRGDSGLTLEKPLVGQHIDHALGRRVRCRWRRWLGGCWG